MPFRKAFSETQSEVNAEESYRFRDICKQNGIIVTNEQREQLCAYAELLLRWNKKVNLISRKDETNVWSKHILHSASLLFHLAFIPSAKLLDLGTGGGLPGIPLKILVPSLEIIVIDSVRKKTIAVMNIIEDLSLIDVRVECGRAEELGKRKDLQNQFDYVVARAVGALRGLVSWSFSFLRSTSDQVRPDSTGDEKKLVIPPALIAMKGGDLGAEIKAAKKDRRVRDVAIIDLSVRGLDVNVNTERKAVVVYM